MKKLYGDVVFISGASSGMGKAVAEALAVEGYKVYGTSRKLEDGYLDDSAVVNKAGCLFR